MHKLIRTVGFALLALSLASCRLIYTPDVYQGNLLDKKTVDQLQPGMTKRQVLVLMGSPSVNSPFSQNEWDYVSTQQHRGGPIKVSNATNTRAAWSNFARSRSEPLVTTPVIRQRQRSTRFVAGATSNLALKAEQVLSATANRTKLVPSRAVLYSVGVLKKVTFSQPLEMPRLKSAANRIWSAHTRPTAAAKINMPMNIRFMILMIPALATDQKGQIRDKPHRDRFYCLSSGRELAN